MAVSRKSQGLPEKETNHEDEDAVDLSVPLVNLGLPIVVVATKCDRASYLEKQLDFRSEQFDFIQYSLRFVVTCACLVSHILA